MDIALTTRELARMIESAGIYFKHLPDEEFDNPLGEGTGAAVIFGATGGVMELLSARPLKRSPARRSTTWISPTCAAWTA